MLNFQLHERAEKQIMKCQELLEKSGIEFTLLIPGHNDFRLVITIIAKTWKVETVYVAKKTDFFRNYHWYQKSFPSYIKSKHQCEVIVA